MVLLTRTKKTEQLAWPKNLPICSRRATACGSTEFNSFCIGRQQGENPQLPAAVYADWLSCRHWRASPSKQVLKLLEERGSQQHGLQT